MSQYPQSIYIHLPFCKTKCPYCDFASFTEKNKDIQSQYLDALANEITSFFQTHKIDKDETLIKTIFFGGGTPSIHSGEEIANIIKRLQSHTIFDNEIEITMEANPGTINLDKLYEFKVAGINRLSIGTQTFNQKLLDKLARGHTVEDTFEIIELIKKVNFKSWSFDLIYGLPKQTLEDLEDTLDLAIKQGSPHISAYALSIETNTPFGDIYKNSYHPELAQETELAEMYKLLDEKLTNNNFERYEVSNWAQTKHECKHNLTYWRAEEYFAFGLSAHGYFKSHRFANTRELQKYMDIYSDKITLSSDKYDTYTKIKEAEQLEEEILLKLRLKEGLYLSPQIKEKLNQEKLNYYQSQDYLEANNKHIKLKDKAFFVSNHIIADLLS
ncbi:MAG: radical SAM family heme chaperone HemW [Candidatus Caenarcaniphilales bacterium]|nr:radical SAM family heme chaperone HemW [Candidatus Caenarcaniphilales bacterium]